MAWIISSARRLRTKLSKLVRRQRPSQRSRSAAKAVADLRVWLENELWKITVEQEQIYSKVKEMSEALDNILVEQDRLVKLVEELAAAEAAIWSELSSLASRIVEAKPYGVQPRHSMVLLKGEPGLVRRLYGKSKTIVNGVAVVQSPSGLIKVAFRPARARDAAKLIAELRQNGAEIVGSEVHAMISRVAKK